MPDVSVVMAVCNGAGALPTTLASLLSQQDCDFEIVVVDDGSTDGSAALLHDAAAHDSRVRVVHQPNAGLTSALMRGCELARGEFIARQDCGDRSLPGRLATQLRLLRAHPGLAFVGCRYALVGPGGEMLSQQVSPATAGAASLVDRHGLPVAGPHHGTVMFRATAYRTAGGYRPEFYFAQDIDLWTRLLERGDFGWADENLYTVRFTLDSITARHRGSQQLLRALALRAQVLRRQRRSEADVLREAAAIRPARPQPVTGVRDPADAAYFVGSCLAERNDPRARNYFARALRSNPLHLRSWYKLMRSVLTLRRWPPITARDADLQRHAPPGGEAAR